jgi:DinB superfamily
MDHNLQQTIALLTRTPAALDALLRGLPDEWTRQNEGPDTWSAFDVLAHLINCERTDWMPRVRVLLEFGESQPFPPFDRWGEIRESQGKSLSELLDVFARLRTQNIAALQALELQSEDFARRGLHPSFGSVTLSELLATWAAHDLNHLHQIARVMAHQYRQAVGPWSRYMGVMQCGGHSSS